MSCVQVENEFEFLNYRYIAPRPGSIYWNGIRKLHHCNPLANHSVP